MGVIDLSTNKPAAQTQGDAVQIANGFQTIQNVINGNLDAANISPTAAIKGSQLATGLNGPPGTRLAYNTQQSNIIGITGTTFAGATAIVSAGTFAFDGTTAVYIEFFSPNVSNSTAGARLFFEISDGGVSIGQLGTKTAIGVSVGDACYLKSHEFAPSNGNHTYSIVAYVSGGTGQVNAGAGGASVVIPAWIKVVKA